MVTQTLPHPTSDARQLLRRAAPHSRRRFAEKLRELAILCAAFAIGMMLQIALVLAFGSIIE
jgi:hypothetical protein